MTLSIRQLSEIIRISLEETKAEDLMYFDLEGHNLFADHIFIASGLSKKKICAIADHVEKTLRAYNTRPFIEGKNTGNWIIMDIDSIVIHLFRPEVRNFYQIEKIWENYLPKEDISENSIEITKNF